jgi:hypothetical protein
MSSRRPARLVHLDWRSAGNDDLLTTIEVFLYSIDRDGKIPIKLYSTSTGAKKGAKLIYVDESGQEVDKESGSRMWLHSSETKPTIKRAPNYLNSMVSVTCRTTEDMAKGVMVPYREFGYRCVGTKVTKAAARRLLMDLALTLESTIGRSMISCLADSV